MELKFTVKGRVTFKVLREDGSTVCYTFDNMLVKWGLDQITAYIAGTGTALGLTHLALGTGTAATTEADTALKTETEREPCTITRLTGAQSHTVEAKVSYALGAVSGTFTEAGLFKANDMFNRTIFAPFPVTVSDTLTIIWHIEVKNI